MTIQCLKTETSPLYPSPLTSTQVDFGLILPGPDVEMRRFGVQLPSALGLQPPVTESTARQSRAGCPRAREHMAGKAGIRRSNTCCLKCKACVGALADRGALGCFATDDGNIADCAGSSVMGRGGGSCCESAQRVSTELDSR